MKNLSTTSFLKESWKLFKKHWTSFYLIAVILLIADGISQSVLDTFINQRQTDGPTNLNNALVFFSGFVRVVIINILAIGWIRTLLRFARNQKVTVKDFKPELRIFFNYVAGTIMLSVIVFTGLLLLIVPGIIWSIKFSFTSYLISDRGMGPLEALKKSARMTEGIKVRLLIISLGFLGVIFAGLLALGAGLLVAVPVVLIAQILVYNRLLNSHAKPIQSK